MTFRIQYVDPPWEYADRHEGQGGASCHYALSGIEDMKTWRDTFLAMRPESGVMLMWVTGPFMEEAPGLMRAWGYTPIKPILYWVKTYPKGGLYYGPGAYTGSNVDFVLLGQANMNAIMPAANRKTKGGDGVGVHEVAHAPDEVIEAAHPRDGSKIIHSKKPDIFRRRIVQLFGDVPRVEVFARERFAGWHAIGDQLPGGERLEAGRVITPIPPPAADIAHRRAGAVEQRGLWASLDQEGA